jgi:hypothetical protein
MDAVLMVLALAVLVVVAAAGPRYAAGSESGAPWRHPTVDEPPASSLRGDLAAVWRRLHGARAAH